MAQIDYSSSRITINIIKTAVPMLVAQMFNLLYSIVDRVYIGRIPGIGAEALGAVGLCFPIIMIITAFTNLFGSGGAPLFSIELGKGNREEADLLMCTAFTLLFWCSLFLFAAGEVFAAPILRLIGALDADTLRVGLTYLRVYLLGTVFQMTALGMNPYINAQGFPGVGMRTIVVGAAANTVLDPIFIFVFGMGIRGAAAATVISQLLSCVSALHFLLKPGTPYRVRLLGRLELSRRRILGICGLGASSFVISGTNSLVQLSCNSVLVRVGGPLYLSVMTIVSSVRQLFDMPAIAFTDGASPVMSFSYGAGRGDRVLKAIRVATLITLFYTAAVWILILLFPESFISIFSRDRTVVEAAVPALHIYFFAFVFMAFQVCGQMAFRALGKKKRTIFFSLLRKAFIVVPLTYVFPLVFGMGTKGVFLAEPVSNVIGGSACFITMLLTVVPELRAMSGAQRREP